MAVLPTGWDTHGGLTRAAEREPLDELIENALLTRRGGSRSGDEINYRCVAHDDNRASASYNVKKGVFYCHACEASGFKLALARALGFADAIGESLPIAIPRLLEVSERVAWTGRSGMSRRAVLRAHVNIAAAAGRVTGYGASVRQIAEAAGMAANTVVRAQKYLRGQKWLTPAECQCGAYHCSFYHGRVWTLAVPDGLALAPPPDDASASRKAARLQNQLAHDAFRRGGLSKSGLLVLEALDVDTGLSTREIAQRLSNSLTLSTIRRALKKMKECHAAVPGPNGRWRRRDTSLDSVAQFFHSDGRGERQRRRHEIERSQRPSAWSNGTDRRDGSVAASPRPAEMRPGRLAVVPAKHTGSRRAAPRQKTSSHRECARRA